MGRTRQHPKSKQRREIRSNETIPGFTIDLHGRNKDEALLVLNQQLIKASWHQNSSKCVLLVIDAGVGKHSSEGSILRPFTRELLEHRGYKFREVSGKFHVIVMNEAHQNKRAENTYSSSQTKMDDPPVKLSTMTKNSSKGGPIPLPPPNISSSRAFPALGDVKTECAFSTCQHKDHPPPPQAAPYHIPKEKIDAVIKNRIAQSSMLAGSGCAKIVKKKQKQRSNGRSRHVLNEALQEIDMLEKVLSESKLEAEAYSIRYGVEHFSRDGSNNVGEDGDEAFQFALALSKASSSSSSSPSSANFISSNELFSGSNEDFTCGGNKVLDKDEEEDDESLHLAIAMSRSANEHVTTSTNHSETDCLAQEEEEALQLAIKLSQQEAYSAAADIDTTNFNDVLENYSSEQTTSVNGREEEGGPLETVFIKDEIVFGDGNDDGIVDCVKLGEVGGDATTAAAVDSENEFWEMVDMHVSFESNK